MAVDQDSIGRWPQVFRWLEFGGIRWEKQQVDVVGDLQALGAVPARTVQHQHDLLRCAGPHLTRECRKLRLKDVLCASPFSDGLPWNQL
jgi:hypothetical protein